jgi:uncharacterized protein YxeA
MWKLLKFIFYILAIIAIGITLYHYFHLDQNKAFQNFIKQKDVKSAQTVAKEVVENQIKAEAKKYAYDNNGYFVSKSNNICVSIQKYFDVLKPFTSNPVECIAEVHTFTARIKTLSNSYYCIDTSGFSTIALSEAGYKAGLSCK